LTFEKEQRQKAHSYLITNSQEMFKLQEENKRLKKEYERPLAIGPNDEDQLIARDIEVARDEAFTK
jgi:hypothetical protein